MRSIKVSISSIEAVASQRKNGYLEEVKRCSVIDNGIATIGFKDFNRIKKEFSLEEPKLPDSPTLVKNFARSIYEETKSRFLGEQKISKEETKTRIEICKSCEKYRPSDNRCSLCGCFVMAKASWRSQKCPIGKW
jgi:hypothetical protein